MPAAASDALILEHLDWSQQVARNVLRRKPASVERDDLLQDGYVGLVKAARAFNPALGVPFRAYALVRIRGEIADQMRRADPVGRKSRREIKRRQTAGVPLSNELERLRTLAAGSCSIDEDPSMTGAVHALRDPAAEEAFSDVIVRDMLRRIPPRERLIVTMGDEGYLLREIGSVLGIGEARTCQIRSRAVKQLAAMAG